MEIKETNKVKGFQARTNQKGGPNKSTLRVAVDSLTPDHSLILDKDSDYQSYRQVYYILRGGKKKSDFKFVIQESVDKKQVIITCYI